MGLHVKLSYPDPPCVRLSTLTTGDCFILNREFRTQNANVYMMVGTPYTFDITCLCLQTGQLKSFRYTSNVIEMVVELKARPITSEDKDELPF